MLLLWKLSRKLLFVRGKKSIETQLYSFTFPTSTQVESVLLRKYPPVINVRNYTETKFSLLMIIASVSKTGAYIKLSSKGESDFDFDHQTRGQHQYLITPLKYVDKVFREYGRLLPTAGQLCCRLCRHSNHKTESNSYLGKGHQPHDSILVTSWGRAAER